MAWQLAVAGMAASFLSSQSSSKAGKAAAKAQEKAWKIEQQLKLGAVQAQTDALIASKQEGFDKAVSNMSQVSREAMMTRGRLASSAGESGLAGVSVSSLFGASFLAEAEARGQEIYNLDKFNKQINREIRGVQSGLMLGAQPSKYDSTGDTMKFLSDSLSIAAAEWG